MTQQPKETCQRTCRGPLANLTVIFEELSKYSCSWVGTDKEKNICCILKSHAIIFYAEDWNRLTINWSFQPKCLHETLKRTALQNYTSSLLNDKLSWSRNWKQNEDSFLFTLQGTNVSFQVQSLIYFTKSNPLIRC